MPKLTVSLPDGTEAVHDLVEDVLTVGRVDDNMIEISDASVSSRHAQLSKDDGDYVLRDLGSTNGTRVNGRELPEGEDIKLGDGDEVIFTASCKREGFTRIGFGECRGVVIG